MLEVDRGGVSHRGLNDDHGRGQELQHETPPGLLEPTRENRRLWM